MYYDYRQNCKEIDRLNDNSKNFIASLQIDDYSLLKKTDSRLVSIVEMYKDLPYTRADFFHGVFYGSILVPALLNHEEIQIIFLIEKDRIFFISNTAHVNKLLHDIIKLRQKNLTDPGTIFYYFLEQLIDNDLEKMNLIQDNLSQLENQIFEKLENNISQRLTGFRTKTLALSHYYLQLTSLSTLLSENNYDYFNKKQIELFSTLSQRISLLKSEADQLWDYTSEVREIYQEQLDLKQNEIMKVLTIVTTIFLPLSLIAAWYGMNFEYMPELSFKYSYFIVMIISLFIVVILCVWFKKKDFW